MRLKEFRYPRRPNSGGTFFTMLIFIMMITSTALMYYYFHRTRSLEKKVAALESGNASPASSDQGFFSFLPWNKEEDIDSNTPAPVAVATPAPPITTPSVMPVGTQLPSDDSLPPSGAVSTPRPNPAGIMDQAIINQPEPSAESPETSLDLDGDEQSEEILPSEPIDGPEAQTGNLQPGASDQNAADGEVNSMYDAPPQVRVRSPRRD